ncbi:MAG: pilus assembly protein PilM [Candidatus Symbiothrix sp.]|jgi:cell division protein FtsA|nr:pilus assembly protein PilM [Candidatus Symbiothrix sp.]
MEQLGYVAAIDLGTSKMLAMAARKNSVGELEVLGTETLPADDCMCRGRISNTDEATNKAHLVVSRLSRQSRLVQGIKQIYIGIGGQSLHTEAYSVKKEINGVVTKETLGYLEKECWDRPEMWKIVSQEYYLDDVLTPNPVGEFCKAIEMRCLLVLARPFAEERDELEKILAEKSTKADVAGFFVSPLATAEAALTPQQKEAGVALVEIGAALTYVSIYKGGQLKSLVTIPLGGDVITKDISTLGVADAEDLKRKNGIVLEETEEADTAVNKIIKARAQEICANIIHQIKELGYESELLNAGIVLTGGGSQLKNLDKLLAQASGKTVQLAPINDPTQACVLGLVLSGKENCAQPVERPTWFEPISKPITISEPTEPQITTNIERLRLEKIERERREKEEREQREKEAKERAQREKEERDRLAQLKKDQEEIRQKEREEEKQRQEDYRRKHPGLLKRTAEILMKDLFGDYEDNNENA